MRKVQLITSIAALAVFGVALADEKTHTEIAIVVDDGQGDATRIELDSAAMGFSLHDLQEGESRSVVDADGRAIVITRNANGYTFNVDGKSVDVPMVHGDHPANVVVQRDHAEVVDVKVLHSADGISHGGPNVSMILTQGTVDAATQEAIRSLLEAAGHGSDVQFIDMQAAEHGPHQVKVVKKVVEVTED